MHFILGFAVIVGLLAFPATRKVVFWLVGLGAVGMIALMILINQGQHDREHDAQVRKAADSALCSPELVRSGNAAIANHRLPTDAEIIARQCELTGH